jgi:hypothetical protein
MQNISQILSEELSQKLTYVENVIKDTDETLTRSVNDIRTLRQSLRDALSASGESRPELD